MITAEKHSSGRNPSGTMQSRSTHQMKTNAPIRITGIVIAGLLWTHIGWGQDMVKLDADEWKLKEIIMFYATLDHKTPVIASNVPTDKSITIKVLTDAPTALSLIRAAVLKQAGVILSEVDEKRFSVTFNNNLK
jgi:hypothetical protein